MVVSFAAEYGAHAGSVVFVHVDGAGLSHWQVGRAVWVGPDGDLNWDKLEKIAVYRGLMSDSLTASSNGGATAHAYGTRPHYMAFGGDAEGRRAMNAQGKRESLMHEAMKSGLRTGLINSGSIIEPGTSAFVATVASRAEDSAEVALQVLESGVDVILSGGEEWLLPKGAKGRFAAGVRQDGRNLIEEARQRGYRVVYTREELSAVPADTPKLLGVFCAEDTFNDMGEPQMLAAGVTPYKPDTPTLAEMTEKTLEILSHGDKQFFLVVEEEGVDNFGNLTNAAGVIEAVKRADDALGVALDFCGRRKDALLITTADSEAGGMELLGYPSAAKFLLLLQQGRDPSGAEWDRNVMGGPPFTEKRDRRLEEAEVFKAKANAQGVELPFVVTWASTYDVSGGIIVRAAGKNAGRVWGSMHNTDVYRVMRETLFDLPDARGRADD